MKNANPAKAIVNKLLKAPFIATLQKVSNSLKKGLAFRPVNLRNIIKDCMSMLSSSIQENQVTVSVDMPPHLPLIKGDRTKLMQLFLYLIKNSMEAISKDDGKRTIVVRGIRRPDLFLLEIADTRYSAAGPDLYKCQDIIKRHEGTITVQCDGPRRGTLTSIQFKVD